MERRNIVDRRKGARFLGCDHLFGKVDEHTKHTTKRVSPTIHLRDSVGSTLT